MAAIVEGRGSEYRDLIEIAANQRGRDHRLSAGSGASAVSCQRLPGHSNLPDHGAEHQKPAKYVARDANAEGET